MTAVQLQNAIIEDLRQLFAGTRYKSTTMSSEADIEALRPDGDEEDWTDYQRAFWASLQSDFRQHKLVPLNVYAQDLPLRETSSPGYLPDEDVDDPPQDYDSEPDPFPYVVVRLSSGGVETPSSSHNVNLYILVGMYDDNPANVGHLAVMDVIERIQLHYLNRPKVGDFQYMDPFQWGLQDEPSYPYYYGYCELHFWARSPRSQQWEELV